MQSSTAYFFFLVMERETKLLKMRKKPQKVSSCSNVRFLNDLRFLPIVYVIRKSVSVKRRLRTADCGLRTADCGLRTRDKM